MCPAVDLIQWTCRRAEQHFFYLSSVRRESRFTIRFYKEDRRRSRDVASWAFIWFADRCKSPLTAAQGALCEWAVHFLTLKHCLPHTVPLGCWECRVIRTESINATRKLILVTSVFNDFSVELRQNIMLLLPDLHWMGHHRCAVIKKLDIERPPSSRSPVDCNLDLVRGMLNQIMLHIVRQVLHACGSRT